MNRTTKIILGFSAGLLSLCLFSAVLIIGGYLWLHVNARLITYTFKTDPANVALASGRIGEYELPHGFGSPFASQLGDISLVGYTGSDGHSHIYLCRLPRYARLIELQLREAAAVQWASSTEQWSVVESGKTVTIGDQEVILLVSEGINSDDQAFRQISGVIQGNNGPILVVFESPVSQWDQAEVEAFLASIQ